MREKKFRIYYKSTLEKINYNLKNNQTVLNYKFKYQSFKHERGKPENRNYISNFKIAIWFGPILD